MASKSTARRYQNQNPAFDLPAGYDIRLTEEQVEFLVQTVLSGYIVDTRAALKGLPDWMAANLCESIERARALQATISAQSCDND